jgi:hypothetical protein
LGQNDDQNLADFHFLVSTDLRCKDCYQSEQADMPMFWLHRSEILRPAILFKDDAVTYNLQFVLIVYRNSPL